jgi:hypothetical protein
MSSKLVITIRQSDRKSRDVSVDAERALIGSAAYCEVQLAQEDAAPEHLLLEVRGDAVIGHARCLRPEPLLNGVPFLDGRILPDSVLRIGTVEMTVTAAAADGKVQSPKEDQSRVRIFAFAMLALTAAVYVVTNDGRAAPLAAPPEAPALWSATDDVSCPRHDAEAAASSAETLRLGASGKRERSPFSPQDGVSAVPLYRRASACLDSIGKPSEAQEAAADAERLRDQMDAQYRIHRVGLERTLIDQDWEGARRHIHVLLSFLGGRSGEYVEWLSNIDRRLQVKTGAAVASTVKTSL